MTDKIQLKDFLTPEQFAEKFEKDPKIVKKAAGRAHILGLSVIISGRKRPVVFVYNEKNRKKPVLMLRPEKQALDIFKDFLKTVEKPTTSQKNTQNINLDKEIRYTDKKIRKTPTNSWSCGKFTTYYLGEGKEERQIVHQAAKIAFDKKITVNIKQEDYDVVFLNNRKELRIRPEATAHKKINEIIKQLLAKGK